MSPRLQSQKTFGNRHLLKIVFAGEKQNGGPIATWPEPSHLGLQEPPQGPLLLDAFAAHVNGHTERQDDNDEQAPNDASCYQRCPAEEERKNISITETLGKISDASETADPPNCC